MRAEKHCVGKGCPWWTCKNCADYTFYHEPSGEWREWPEEVEYPDEEDFT